MDPIKTWRAASAASPTTSTTTTLKSRWASTRAPTAWASRSLTSRSYRWMVRNPGKTVLSWACRRFRANRHQFQRHEPVIQSATTITIMAMVIIMRIMSLHRSSWAIHQHHRAHPARLFVSWDTSFSIASRKSSSLRRALAICAISKCSSASSAPSASIVVTRTANRMCRHPAVYRKASWMSSRRRSTMKVWCPIHRPICRAHPVSCPSSAMNHAARPCIAFHFTAPTVARRAPAAIAHHRRAQHCSQFHRKHPPTSRNSTFRKSLPPPSPIRTIRTRITQAAICRTPSLRMPSLSIHIPKAKFRCICAIILATFISTR